MLHRFNERDDVLRTSCQVFNFVDDLVNYYKDLEKSVSLPVLSQERDIDNECDVCYVRKGEGVDWIEDL